MITRIDELEKLVQLFHENFATITETVEVTGIKQTTLTERVKRGYTPAFHVGRSTFIPRFLLDSIRENGKLSKKK